MSKSLNADRKNTQQSNNLPQNLTKNLSSNGEKEPSQQYQQIINERIQNRLAEARASVEKKEYYQAINGFTKVIFLKPNGAETYKELGDVYSTINDNGMAITLYKKANKLSYSLSTEEKIKDLLFRKGFQLLQQGEFSDILEGSPYEQFSKRLRYDLDSILKQVYYYQNQQPLPGEAESDEAEAILIKRKKAFQHFLRGYCFLLTYHKTYALEELDMAIQINDKYIHALLMKGKVLWSLNKIAEGNAIFWTAENISNEHPEVKEFLSLILPKADELLKETRSLLVQNHMDRCLINVKKGLELFPNNTQFLLIKAFISRKAGEYENALNSLLLAFHTLREKDFEFEVKNQFALTYNEMGMVCFDRNQFQEAISLFNESLQFKPGDWGVLVNRGDCHRLQNRFDDALKDYLKAQKLAENQPELSLRISMMRNSRGIVLFNQKRYDKALKEFNEAIKLNDKIAQYYLNRAKCYLEMKDMKQGIEDYIQCNKLDPSNTEVAVIVNKLKQESVLKKKNKVISINNAN